MAKKGVGPQLLLFEEERQWPWGLGLDLKNHVLFFVYEMMSLTRHHLHRCLEWRIRGSLRRRLCPEPSISLHQSSHYLTEALARWQARVRGSAWVFQTPSKPRWDLLQRKIIPCPTPPGISTLPQVFILSNSRSIIFTEDNYIRSLVLVLGSFNQYQPSWSDLSLALLPQPHDGSLCLPAIPPPF